jgi:hypothetical protein
LLLAAFFFVPNEMIRMVLTQFDLIDPLTQLGSPNQPPTFAAAFALLATLLAATALPAAPRTRPV